MSVQVLLGVIFFHLYVVGRNTFLRWKHVCFGKRAFFVNIRCSNGILLSKLFWPTVRKVVLVIKKKIDMRNLQEQIKKVFCYQKLFWRFTVWMNWSGVREKCLEFEAEGREFAKKFSQWVRTILITKYHCSNHWINFKSTCFF